MIYQNFISIVHNNYYYCVCRTRDLHRDCVEHFGSLNVVSL